MPRNIWFGRRINAAMKELSLDWSGLAQLTLLAAGRLALLEKGQLDHLDFSGEELTSLARVVNCSVDFLVYGFERPSQSEQVIVAQRSAGARVQQEFSFAPGSCLSCGEPGNGSRCQRCGGFLE